MADLLKGVAVADALTSDLIDRVAALKNKNIYPKLSIIRVGENGGDISYERGIEKRFGKIGIEIEKNLLSETASKEEILAAIEKANNDDAVHGCLLLRPLADKAADDV